ncbi:MAG TPA: extracellular solute-binding protein [Vicinamibacteria bacterium]|nr:extracellular solute-binding protein [Vicinamibacteria bacterium]
MKRLQALLVGTLLFLHLPVLALAVFSLSRSRLSASFDGPSLVWYQKLLDNGPLMRAMENSLIVGGLATLIVLILATAAALGSRAGSARIRARSESLFLLPLVTPEVVFGASLLAFFSRLLIPLGLATVVAAHVVFSLSFAFFVIRARAHALPVDVEEAAADLGASPGQVFRRVTLPLLAPGLVAAGLLTFSLSIDDYVVTSFVAGAGGTTLPVYIYSLLKSSLSPEVAAASTLLLAATTLLLCATALIESRPRLSMVAMAAGLSILATPVVLARSKHSGTRELNLYLWSNYIAPETIRKFEERTGAKVNLDVYDSAEALLSKMLAGNPGYDVICPPTYILAPLIRAGVLSELDHDSLPHLGGTSPDFLGQDWDPENRFSIPYLWGVTGIASDSRRVPSVDSWSALLDPRWKGRILMLDDAREAIAFAALILGLDPNTRDPDSLARIRKVLIDQKPLVRAYDSASFDDAVLSGEVTLAQSWSGQIAKIMKEAPWVRFTIPREGAMVFVDNLAIPRNAPHQALAREFLDFVMEPEIAAEICLTTGYSTPSRAGRALLPRQVQDNRAMFPSEAQMKQLRPFEDLGEAAALHDRLWTEVKSGRD